MQTGRISSTISVGGISFAASVSRQAEGQVSHIVDLPAGLAGAISAAGVDGLPTGHGLVQSDVIDVHWTDPGDSSHKCRRGLVVDVTSTNAIEFDEEPEGEGDALPAVETPVVVGKQVPIDTDWLGELVELIAIKATKRAVADFREAAASKVAVKLVANEAWSWASGQGVDNPFLGEAIAGMAVSNGSTEAAIFYCGLLYQSA